APPGSAAGPGKVGACPRCRGDVAERFKYFACSACDFKLWKRVAGKRISAALAAVLLGRGRTRRLPGFRSKGGKRFAAALVLDGGEVRLELGAARPRPARTARPRPSPPEGALCPACGRGGIVTGEGAGGCARWRDGCRLVVPFEAEGRPITAAQLRALLVHGVTKRTRRGRLRLDLAADPPALRVEPAPAGVGAS